MANYDWWRAALAGGKIGEGDLLVHDGDAQPGFYRARPRRNEPFLPVAIWEHEGKMVALWDNKPVDPAEAWSRACRHPITKEQYDSAFATGKWHDDDKAVVRSVELGDNNPPTDEAEMLQGQIEAAAAGVSDYAEIADDAVAARAQSLRARLLELSGTADRKREAEKKPHLEAGKAIDARWQPLVRMAKEAADRIRSALSAHETRKAKAKAESEVAARAASVQAINQNKPMPPPEPEPVRTQVRGAYGKAASIRAVKVARIIDQDVFYPFVRTNKEVVDLLAKLAQRAVDAGLAPAGVEITEERVVR